MPSWKELKRFCDRDGWELYKTTDHYFYRKRLANGDILFTKVSMGSGFRFFRAVYSSIHRRVLADLSRASRTF